MIVDQYVANQMANLARVWFSVNRAGVCGLIAKSSYHLDEANVRTHALLAQLVELEFSKHPNNILIHRISVSEGSYKMSSVVSQLHSSVSCEFKDKDLFLATGVTSFHVITGRHSSKSPLTGEAIEAAVKMGNLMLNDLIPVTLPFVTKKYAPYELNDIGDGKTEIIFPSITSDRMDEFQEYLESVR